MNPEQTRSLITICLMAAFADGHQDPREREHVRRVAESLSAQAGMDFMPLYQDVLLKRISLEQAVEALGSPELRQLAFETAVVRDADALAETPVDKPIPEIPAAAGPDQAELDRMILNAAILNGALELL